MNNCNYGNLKDKLLRDRLVVGISDQELSKKLQLDADLTLEKTKKTIRLKEALIEQHYILQGNDTKEPFYGRNKMWKVAQEATQTRCQTTVYTE